MGTTTGNRRGTEAGPSSPGTPNPDSDSALYTGESEHRSPGFRPAARGASNSESDESPSGDLHFADAVAAVAPSSNSDSDDDEGEGGAAEEVGGGRSVQRRRPRISRAAEMFLLYMRTLSPAAFLRRARNCYVTSVSDCAQAYANTYYQPYGGGGNLDWMRSPHHFPSSLGRDEQLRFDSYYARATGLKSTSSGGGMSPSAAFAGGQFRRSLPDYESRHSAPAMRRAYSDGGGGPMGGYRARTSPVFTPSRMGSGGALGMFPIEETPEHNLPSFRSDTSQSSLADPPETDPFRDQPVFLPPLPRRTRQELPTFRLFEPYAEKLAR